MKSRNIAVQRIGILLSLLLPLAISVSDPAVAQESITTWDKPVQVQRQAKPKRVYRARRKYNVRPRVEHAPLLTVQYRVLIKRRDGTAGESSALSVFHPGDQLRLGVTANQDGFLYIIYQKEGQDGVIQFPDSRVNNGENHVSRNQEFVLPPINCPVRDPSDCWYKVSRDPAKEYFIIAFSRDQILDLPNSAGGSNEAVKQALSSGVLKKEVIDSYLNSVRGKDYKISGPPPRANSPASYAIWVTNMNPSDNEEIILRVPLNKGL